MDDKIQSRKLSRKREITIQGRGGKWEETSFNTYVTKRLYMPELLLKSAWMWLQGAVVSWTIFNPVGRVRQGVNLQVNLYADHPAALLLIWKMQEECSLLYKEITEKEKKRCSESQELLLKTARGDTVCHSRNWKKLCPRCFSLNVEPLTSGMMVMDAKDTRLIHLFLIFEGIGLNHSTCHSVMTQMNPLSEIAFSHFI